jgi:hypothetical protein
MRLILKRLVPAIVVGIVAAILAISANARPQRGCDKKLESRVLDQPEPKDWTGLYGLFKQFGVCDDGAIGEGFSEDVARLFSKQWAHLATLSRLTASDKAFEKFVLRHIDATISDDELKAIANNSKLRCPAEEKRLCQLVRARVQSSLDELRNHSK